MTDLGSIVHATRRSASAVKRMQQHKCALRECIKPLTSLEHIRLLRRYERAERDYWRAQAILSASPLPGDKQPHQWAPRKQENAKPFSRDYYRLRVKLGRKWETVAADRDIKALLRFRDNHHFNRPAQVEQHMSDDTWRKVL